MNETDEKINFDLSWNRSSTIVDSFSTIKPFFDWMDASSFFEFYKYLNTSITGENMQKKDYSYCLDVSSSFADFIDIHSKKNLISLIVMSIVVFFFQKFFAKKNFIYLSKNMYPNVSKNESLAIEIHYYKIVPSVYSRLPITNYQFIPKHSIKNHYSFFFWGHPPGAKIGKKRFI